MEHKSELQTHCLDGDTEAWDRKPEKDWLEVLLRVRGRGRVLKSYLASKLRIRA